MAFIPEQNNINQAALISTIQNSNELTQNTYQVPLQYWLRLTPMMQEGSGTRAALLLPYVFVRNSTGAADQWKVVSTGITPSSTPSSIRFPVEAPGQYRLYVKEPSVSYTPEQAFKLPRHALTNGQLSDREVQPWYAFTVTENSTPNTLLVFPSHPNTLNRPATDYSPSGPSNTLTNTHLSPASALHLGEYIITNKLWGDISQTYGNDHPTIAESPHRSALTIIYGEQLTVNGNARILTIMNHNRQILFDATSTSGGSGNARSFQNDLLMSRDESLRRTHPTVMEFLLETMQELNIHYARVTGAWRPHAGSTRHRYASALDLTHLRTYIQETAGNPVEIEYRLHRTDAPGPESNPLGTGMNLSAQRRRSASISFHRHLAQQRTAQRLGWLGGPWALTYEDVGLSGNTLFIKTDALHIHHVHISVGLDQP